MSNVHVGERLRDARERSGMSMADVARKIGVSYRSVASWENGLCSPRFDTVARLADLYGCSIDELAGLKRKGSRLPTP